MMHTSGDRDEPAEESVVLESVAVIIQYEIRKATILSYVFDKIHKHRRFCGTASRLGHGAHTIVDLLQQPALGVTNYAEA